MAVHIIEDDFAVCDALALCLREMGHTVYCYSDGEDFFSAGPPDRDDTVVVDLGLPGIAGHVVINWLTLLSAPPKIVVISGKPKAVVERCLRGSPKPILLRKPLSLPALTEHISPLLSVSDQGRVFPVGTM